MIRALAVITHHLALCSRCGLQGQEDGSFAGSFAAYLQRRASLLPDTLFIDAEADLLPEEQVILRYN
jgi:hypothetical protein